MGYTIQSWSALRRPDPLMTLATSCSKLGIKRRGRSFKLAVLRVSIHQPARDAARLLVGARQAAAPKDIAFVADAPTLSRYRAVPRASTSRGRGAARWKGAPFTFCRVVHMGPQVETLETPSTGSCDAQHFLGFGGAAGCGPCLSMSPLAVKSAIPCWLSARAELQQRQQRDFTRSRRPDHGNDMPPRGLDRPTP